MMSGDRSQACRAAAHPCVLDDSLADAVERREPGLQLCTGPLVSALDVVQARSGDCQTLSYVTAAQPTYGSDVRQASVIVRQIDQLGSVDAQARGKGDEVSWARCTSATLPSTDYPVGDAENCRNVSLGQACGQHVRRCD